MCEKGWGKSENLKRKAWYLPSGGRKTSDENSRVISKTEAQRLRDQKNKRRKPICARPREGSILAKKPGTWPEGKGGGDGT